MSALRMGIELPVKPMKKACASGHNKNEGENTPKPHKKEETTMPETTNSFSAPTPRPTHVEGAMPTGSNATTEQYAAAYAQAQQQIASLQAQLSAAQQQRVVITVPPRTWTDRGLDAATVGAGFVIGTAVIAGVTAAASAVSSLFGGTSLPLPPPPV